MFESPFFWRHFVTYVSGAALVGLGLAFPPTAPYFIPAGAGLLGLAGTRTLEPKDKTP